MYVIQTTNQICYRLIINTLVIIIISLWLFLQVAFEDVLAEPSGINSANCIWLNSYKCFNCGKNCCYKLLTLLCGICIALFWGCQFAVTAFQYIWCCTPQYRMYTIWCGMCQKYCGTTINCCITPLCSSCGYFLNNMRLQKM